MFQGKCLIQLGGQDGWGGKQNCEQEPDLSYSDTAA